jgi:hypothetical protein
MISTLPSRSFPAPRRSVLKSGLIALFGTSICVYLFYCLNNGDTWHIKNLKFDSVSFPYTKRPEATQFCTAEEYANGHWVRRENPPSTLDEIRTLYGVKVSSPILTFASRCVTLDIFHCDRTEDDSNATHRDGQ